ncbi:Bug family tripartite tricarboxylate transporter substrate binding protein [Nocardiopsis tropica]|jgi:putative tricarboxylic transport membrane protein|uniref:Tripartite tricarboxylate transporter substrate-binding protein n=1 Tax=Nocardiopsis tropica TaxID=109330 RepID=A0ABU7L0J5_9ACTN|nr:tripartite tricarboxylate transporter substrate-binding protein [Nocardiopsis umidischolae]MEE2055076.1 tripartite tricarboxylate transporter substrate-binding protein [Nocardiopsis umidischolae]
MRDRGVLFRVGGGLCALLLVGTALFDVRQSAAAGSGQQEKLLLIAPAGPGGGWDTLAREMQNGLREEDLRFNVEVRNAEGAGGTIGLAQTAGREGQSNVLTMTGLGMVGAVETTGSLYTMEDSTPIAQLASEYLAVVVPADSPYETLDDLAGDWRERSGTLPVAGGSMGGVDQIFAAQVARSMDIAPGEINYLPYSGGGEVLTSLLSGTSEVGFGTLGDFSDQVDGGGPLRALAVSSPERMDGVDVPTLAEQGYDVEMSNWRGVIAPPGLTGEEADRLEGLVRDLLASDAWADTLERNRWTDTFQPREEFGEFLDAEVAVTQETVEELGL